MKRVRKVLIGVASTFAAWVTLQTPADVLKFPNPTPAVGLNGNNILCTS